MPISCDVSFLRFLFVFFCVYCRSDRRAWQVHYWQFFYPIDRIFCKSFSFSVCSPLSACIASLHKFRQVVLFMSTCFEAFKLKMNKLDSGHFHVDFVELVSKLLQQQHRIICFLSEQRLSCVWMNGISDITHVYSSANMKYYGISFCWWFWLWNYQQDICWKVVERRVFL